MVARLVRLEWLETIDTSLTPNFVENIADNYKGRSFDPDTNMAAPWQSGMTGIGFDKNKTGDLDSIEVFFSDEFKGKLTFLSEMRDTIGLSAIRLGDKPEELTQEQFDKALAEVDKAIKDKIVRQVVGNSYVEDMAGGGVILAMAWSGDVLTLLVPDQKPDQDFQWALPKEGGMLWTDNYGHPQGDAEQGPGGALDRLLLRAPERRDDRGIRQLRLPREGRQGGHARERPRSRQQSADLPA